MKLQQCPFCGEDLYITESCIQDNMYFGLCNNEACFFETRPFKTEQEVADFLNTRHVPKPKPVRIEDLKVGSIFNMTITYGVSAQNHDGTINAVDSFGYNMELTQANLDACNAELVE